MMAVADCFDRGLGDVIGSAKIRLTNPQADDVASLRRQRIGPRQHGKSIFLSQMVEGRYSFQHMPDAFFYGPPYIGILVPKPAAPTPQLGHCYTGIFLYPQGLQEQAY